MATLDQLQSALVKADAAGDTEAARAFAGEIRRMMVKAAPIENDAISQGARNFANEMGAGQKFLAGIGSGMNSVKQALTFAPKAEVDETKRLDAPLQNTGAGFAGNIAGNIAATAPAMFIPGANTILGAGVIGAGVGALTTPGDMQDRATGAAFGGAGGMVGQAIPRSFSAAKAAAEPLTEKGRAAIIGRVINRAAGDNAGAVTQRLNSAAPLVPGSMPTAAEVAESGGIAALQRAMSAADPEAYAHRGMEQGSARINALRGIAGDQQKMAAALRARDVATKPLYAASDAAVTPITPELKNVLSRLPNGTMAKAQDIGRMSGRPIQFGKDVPAREIAAIDASGVPVLQMSSPQQASISGRGVDLIKKAIDEVISADPQAAIGAHSKAAATGVKRELTDIADAAIPEYGAARKAFGDLSKPINQMKVGQVLLDKLQGPLADHGALAKETGSMFARALRNDGETAARAATKMRQGIDDVLTPQQMQTVNAIAQDLARKANAQDLGRGVGSNTFQNFAMDNLAKQSGMPSAVPSLLSAIPGISPTITLLTKGAGALGGMAYKSKDEAMRQAMAKALLDPKTSAALMEAAGKPSALVRLLQKLPQDKLPADDVLRLMQAMPGLAGASALPAYLEK